MKTILKLMFFLMAYTSLPFLPVAYGQGNVTVNATVVDSDGQAWFGGSWQIVLVVPPPGTYYNKSTGQSFAFPANYAGTLDGTGSFSQALMPVSNILPAGTTWQFKVCPQVYSATCGVVNIPVNASGSVSSQINAVITAPRVTGGPGVYAYSDIEVAAFANNSYFNVTTQTNRCYSTSWGACGTGGGGGPPTGPAGGVLSGNYPNPGLASSGNLPNGWTCTTQSTGDNSNLCATDAFVLANAGSGGTPSGPNTSVQFDNGGVFGGDASLTFNSTTKTLTSQILNGVVNCASPSYAGATITETINACNAAALSLSTGGNASGVMDLRGLGNSNFADGQIFIGNTSGTPVTALMPANGTWKAANTFSSTSQCLLRVGKNVTILGSNPGGTNGFQLLIPGSYSGTGLYAGMCTDNTIGGYLRIEGIAVECEGPVNASGHCVDIENTFDNVWISNLTVRDQSGSPGEIGWYSKDICCATTIANLNVNCNYTAGCTPAYFDSPVSGPGSQQVKLLSPSLDHPGAGQHALVISDTRNPGATAMQVDNPYSEMSTSDTTTSAFYVTGTQGVTFNNPYCNYEITSSTAPCVEFNYGSAVPTDVVNGMTINNAATYPVVAAVKNDATSLNRATDANGFLGHYDTSSTNYFNAINLPNSGVITGRNSGNTADLGMLRLNGSNYVQALQTLYSSVSGAVSLPAMEFQGQIYNSGSGTTNLPYWLIQPSAATAATTWSLNGTWIGINPATGFTGNFIDFHVPNGGASVFSVGYAGLATAASIVDSGLTPSANAICANGSGGAFVNTGCSTTSSVLWSSILSPTGALSLSMQSYQTALTYGAATGSADLFKLTDTANNTGTGIIQHVATASGSTEIPWQADANGTGWQVNASGNMVSTNAINNAAITFQPGSGGASTCPTAVAGSSFLCTNANDGISYSNNGAAYTPLSGQAIPYTITASSTPGINMTNGSVQTITLNANATATVSNITSGVSLTMQICQPASGGPYTWAWPAGIHGGITIGTTASDCSMQEFRSFNGTTLVAINPGVINVAP